jgi:hypothetical protein
MQTFAEEDIEEESVVMAVPREVGKEVDMVRLEERELEILDEVEQMKRSSNLHHLGL